VASSAGHDGGDGATAVAFVAPRRVELVGVDLPAPAPGEVVVRTLWSGISSGTEMLAYRGEIDPALPLDESIGALGGSFSFPFRYGYSCVGRVERSRGGAAEGSLVFAYHPHQDVFVAGGRDVVPVDGIDPRRATLLPLVETALQVALDAGPVLEEVVVVTGLGAVGLLASVVLQRAGARVVGVEPSPERRAAAGALGLRAVAPDGLVGALAGVAPAGVPLLVEASGRPDALRAGLRLLAHEGEALVVSWYGTKDARLPLGADFHRRRLRIRSTQVSTIPAALAGRWTVARRRAVARDLLGELPLGPVATHAFPFADAARAFAAVDGGAAGLVHAALCYT
jgi:2-desacetyl-2-hydroxyethyl bacteriochlorophyllide A dehydrogenase